MLQAWHLWLCEANYRGVEEIESIPVRPHVLAYQAPTSSLTETGPVVLPAYARTISCACELAFEVGREVHRVDEESAQAAIRGYRVLAGFRDSSLIEQVSAPTARDQGVCVYYARWADTFNPVSELAEVAEGTLYPARMRLQVGSFPPVETSTADYLHRAPAVIAALSQFMTLQPGDIISLGRAGLLATFLPEQRLPAGSRVVAEIDRVGRLEVPIEDRRTPA